MTQAEPVTPRRQGCCSWCGRAHALRPLGPGEVVCGPVCERMIEAWALRREREALADPRCH